MCATEYDYVLLFLFHTMPAPPDIDCGNPGFPSHGAILDYSTVYTSEVRYECNAGYTLQGPDRRTCQSNGTWSGSLPQCSCRFIGNLFTDNNYIDDIPLTLCLYSTC